MSKGINKHLIIAGILEIILGVASILLLRHVVGNDAAFIGLTEEAMKGALFGVTGIYVVNGLKILAGLLGIVLSAKRSLITVICGIILFLAQLITFIHVGSSIPVIIINIILLIIPYYYLHNAWKNFRAK